MKKIRYFGNEITKDELSKIKPGSPEAIYVGTALVLGLDNFNDYIGRENSKESLFEFIDSNVNEDIQVKFKKILSNALINSFNNKYEINSVNTDLGEEILASYLKSRDLSNDAARYKSFVKTVTVELKNRLNQSKTDQEKIEVLYELAIDYSYIAKNFVKEAYYTELYNNMYEKYSSITSIDSKLSLNEFKNIFSQTGKAVDYFSDCINIENTKNNIKEEKVEQKLDDKVNQEEKEQEEKEQQEREQQEKEQQEKEQQEKEQQEREQQEKEQEEKEQQEREQQEKEQQEREQQEKEQQEREQQEKEQQEKEQQEREQQEREQQEKEQQEKEQQEKEQQEREQQEKEQQEEINNAINDASKALTESKKHIKNVISQLKELENETNVGFAKIKLGQIQQELDNANSKYNTGDGLITKYSLKCDELEAIKDSIEQATKIKESIQTEIKNIEVQNEEKSQASKQAKQLLTDSRNLVKSASSTLDEAKSEENLENVSSLLDKAKSSLDSAKLKLKEGKEVCEKYGFTSKSIKEIEDSISEIEREIEEEINKAKNEEKNDSENKNQKTEIMSKARSFVDGLIASKSVDPKEPYKGFIDVLGEVLESDNISIDEVDNIVDEFISSEGRINDLESAFDKLNSLRGIKITHKKTATIAFGSNNEVDQSINEEITSSENVAISANERKELRQLMWDYMKNGKLSFGEVSIILASIANGEKTKDEVISELEKRFPDSQDIER